LVTVDGRLLFSRRATPAARPGVKKWHELSNSRSVVMDTASHFSFNAPEERMPTVDVVRE